VLNDGFAVCGTELQCYRERATGEKCCDEPGAERIACAGGIGYPNVVNSRTEGCAAVRCQGAAFPGRDDGNRTPRANKSPKTVDRIFSAGKSLGFELIQDEDCPE
jgi:hypothetical protein